MIDANLKKIALIGNPNCGKTTIFNHLTGTHQKVGNWAGVTVERKIGTYTFNKTKIEVIDLPGVYSLKTGKVKSTDEEIARDFVLSDDYDLVVNIIDASNLERGLYLTTQLMDMEIPMVIVLNMMDIAIAQKIDIHIKKLSESLGTEVVSVIAKKNIGIKDLQKKILNTLHSNNVALKSIPFDAEIKVAIAAITLQLEGKHQKWKAMQALRNVERFKHNKNYDSLKEHVDKMRDAIKADPDFLIKKARYNFISDVLKDSIKKEKHFSETISDRIDSVVINRWLGVPIFLGIMYLMFLFTINIGGAFIDFFDISFGAIFVDGMRSMLENIHTPELITLIVANGIGGGIQTIATFIPIIAFLYIFLSILEESGYMARAAFVMDHSMRKIGLSGKAFVPLIIGFGCTIPAIMSTRTLDSIRDRIAVIMMSPFMSCGAKLPVYVLFATVFFPKNGQNIVFVLYLIGILVAILTGLLIKKIVFRKPSTSFIMDLPPYNLPSIKNVTINTWNRVNLFVFGAGKIIIPIVTVLIFFSSIGTDGSLGHEDSEDSVLASIGKSITPIIEPMGVKEENWPAAVGMFTGLFAKEALVGTLDSLYNSMAHKENEDAKDSFDLVSDVKKAFLTIPENLLSVKDSLLDPLGISVGDITELDKAAEEQGVNATTFTIMKNLFDGKIGAFSYLLFILLYSPCVAAIAAVYREFNLFWTCVVIGWSTLIAYFVAVFVYQVATYTSHPISSLYWISGISVTLLTIIAYIRYICSKYDYNTLQSRLLSIGFENAKNKKCIRCKDC